jgi:threonine aldolase
MSAFNRRLFLKKSGLGLVPAVLPFGSAIAARHPAVNAPSSPVIKLFGDGEMFDPNDYISELQKANASLGINKDRYGVGGVVEALEKKFADITGKEKAIYMPTGTMANQLAIAVLSGENTKIFVQDLSHVHRDEADAAQSVFQRRLMPLAKGETYFTAQDLKNAIDSLPQEEAFKSGVGAVSIENPVRRRDGRMVPLGEIEKISAYCRANGIKLHLDGARLYMASAWSGVPIKQYATYFDTVYISLYKYLGAAGGAVLCGSKAVIDKMPHLVKVHGGSMYGNWPQAAMALYRVEGFEQRLKEAVKRSNEIFTALNAGRRIAIKPLDGGTNIYNLQLDKGIDGKKLQERLVTEFNIRMPHPNQNNQAQISVNETLLYKEPAYIINAFEKAMG